MSILSVALTLFIVANPLGNSPAILALIKNFDFKRQKIIMLREAIFAFFIAIFFQFFGEPFLELIIVKDYSLVFTGGLLLMIVALDMIFPKPISESSALVREPFFVPIATPLITGPGLMTTIMIFSRQMDSSISLTIALAVSWIGVTLALYSIPYLLIILKQRGMMALEQLMGMILMLISVQMMVNALYLYLES